VITSPAFRGKRYAVLGLARSGLATVGALLASGAEVLAWDNDATKRKAIAHLGREGETLFIDDFTDWQEMEVDAIVLSPGVPLNRLPLAARAKAAGVPVIGDIELFALARPSLPPHKVVGITGTNGKSTTTALIHHILQTAGIPSLMGGNIGLPILSQAPLPEGGVYVLELSSYQIDLTFSLDCDVAVLTNITPDHLDRYDGFEGYVASKARLFDMQSFEHHALIASQDGPSEAIGQTVFDRHFNKRVGPIYQEAFADEIIDQASYPALQGPHNAQNIAAARMACILLGINRDAIEQALCTYPGLPHRMERVAEKDGVLYVNDSKATNATATAPALAAYPLIHWILGGVPKTDDLDDCAPYFDHVLGGYTIGEAGPMFADILRAAGKPVTESGTLAQAVRDAYVAAKPGEVVMLSPACASFDQFRDYEARGDAFRAAVAAL
jgi:UDP-N-acetylmuramoylalanine--D-glutamate ligase